MLFVLGLRITFVKILRFVKIFEEKDLSLQYLYNEQLKIVFRSTNQISI